MVDYEMKQVLHDTLIDRAKANQRPLYEDTARPEAVVRLQENELCGG